MRNRLRRAVLLTAIVGLLCTAGSLSFAAQAGSVSITSTWVGMGLTRYDIAWTSSAGGAVSANALFIKRGYIYQCTVIPGSGGTQPTNNYTMLFNDPNGVDLLISAGAALSNTATRIFTFNPPTYWDGIYPGTSIGLDLVISNAGNAKTGTFVVLIGNLWGSGM